MISMSCDDGCKSDVRVADLCRRYEVQCVFYWPVEWRSLAYSKGYEPLNILEALDIAQSFEIGSHTCTHRYLTQIPQNEAEIEIADSKFMLEALWNKPVTKFCPPRGYTNNYLTEFALTNLYKSQRLTKGLGLVHVHPNSGANGNVDWKDYYRLVKECGEAEVIECWMHSWELDKYNLWDELEEFIKAEA